MGRAGTYRNQDYNGESVQIFYPTDLPPDPPLSLTQSDLAAIERATLYLGRLDALSQLIPDTSLFLYYYIRKEALLSSQIEGTQSSFSEFLLSEKKSAPGVPTGDVADVSNYVAAINYGLERLHELPLSLRLIREIHEILLSRGRGANLSPGEFRTTQNWIGGTRPGNARFVPPPPEEIVPRMGELEKFLHRPQGEMPFLVKAALSHVQFETIHPFLDGNGRLGRLLVTFLFCSEKVLSQPVLYLSLYFKRRRDTYYELLQKVRDEGKWEEWVRFFVEGVQLVSLQAVETAQRIKDLFSKDKERIAETFPKKKLGSLTRVHEAFQRDPLLSVPEAAEAASVASPTARDCIKLLCELGMLREVTEKKRDRIYAYDEYFGILSEGTEPIARNK